MGAVTNFMKEVGEQLDGGFSYEHFGWEAVRNVGLVKTRPGKHEVQVSATHLMARGKSVEEVHAEPPKKGGSWWAQWKPW
eukprot:NODE_2768_length_743_cov_223.606628_g1945_i0.p1 GENE.NODE_2768_length_743_cov_223.606628_g1945_i0~~NODE_2768_length_743_cov_223.606628_g1945_i0.p1  ORF type:complete len:87 (+),score=40.37 NODE_2768_length_743_cov_223.606628_g1945_i0:24-263(+)